MNLSGRRTRSIDSLDSDLLGSAAMLEQNFFGMDGTWFSSGLGVDVPNANVSETEKELKIEIAVPGLERRDFKVEVTDVTLQVRVKRGDDACDALAAYSRREFSFDSFVRSFALPGNISRGAIDAKYECGILIILIPKTQGYSDTTVHRIPVK